MQKVKFKIIAIFKIRPRHHHLESPFYYDDFVPFAHDPPGHTCGLPCCNSDLHIHLKVGRSHGGCMSVPMQQDYPGDNFTLQRGHLGLFKNQNSRPGYKGGFYSVQPARTGIPPRREMPEFGSVRGKTLPVSTSGLSGTHVLSDQINFLRGRGITLPKIARTDPTAFKRSSPFILAGGNVGETADSDSEMSSDSDLDYYMLSDFKTHVQVANNETRHPENITQENSDKQQTLYPWKMLEETQMEPCKSESQSDGSTYYDVIEDLKSSNYSWSRPNSQSENKSENDFKIDSPKYCKLNFESNLFTPDRRHTLDPAMKYNPVKYDVPKKKHRKRRAKPPVPSPKPRAPYTKRLSDSYKSSSLPPVLQNFDIKTVEEAKSRLRKVSVPPQRDRRNTTPYATISSITSQKDTSYTSPHTINNPVDSDTDSIESSMKFIPDNRNKQNGEKRFYFAAPHLGVSTTEKSRSLPINKGQNYVNKGFVKQEGDNSIEILKRLVHDFKSQSLPPMIRPISYEAAKIARSRLNSSKSLVDDVFYRQNINHNRLPTLDEDPITLIL